MNLPFEWQIGWRYTRAGRSGRRNGFISFISGVSMLGISLGVAALIIVLSVMNGFQKEVRDRMLSIIAHVEVREATGGALPDWRATAAAAQRNTHVIGAAPFVVAQALVGRGDELRGAIVRGIDPAVEGKVTDLARTQAPLLAQLKAGEWNIVLGVELARLVGARIGDKVTIVAPGGQVTPAGVRRVNLNGDRQRAEDRSYTPHRQDELDGAAILSAFTAQDRAIAIVPPQMIHAGRIG